MKKRLAIKSLFIEIWQDGCGVVFMAFFILFLSYFLAALCVFSTMAIFG